MRVAFGIGIVSDRSIDMNGHVVVGGSFIGAALVGYVWFMAAELVPATVELAAVLGMSVSAPVAWLGLTAVAIAVVVGVNKSTR